jgi:hypothetical protein
VATENILDLVKTLTPQEQDAVRQFIDCLKNKGRIPTSPFLAAIDEFIDQHPELLRRLAQ